MVEQSRHQAVAFEDVASSPPTPAFLAVSSFGKAGSGKTEFCCKMPGKTVIIPLNRKTRPTVEAYIRRADIPAGKILMPKTDLIRHEKPMELMLLKPEEAVKRYAGHIDRVMDAVYSAVGRKDIDSIAIDSGTQLSEDLLMSHYGRRDRIMPRDRGPYNNDWKDIFNACQGKHLLVTHEAKEIWRNEKPTGKFEWDGFARLDYYSNVVIEQEYDEKTVTWYASIARCQARPDLMGDDGRRMFSNDEIGFYYLAAAIWPEMEDPERWL